MAKPWSELRDEVMADPKRAERVDKIYREMSDNLDKTDRSKEIDPETSKKESDV